MSKSTAELMVGDSRYLVTHYSPTLAGELFIELTKRLGNVVGLLAGKDKDAEIDYRMIAELIQNVVPKFERGDFTRLAREIFTGTVTFLETGQNIALNEVYDIHFQGRLSHLYKVLAAVIKFQYADFLGGPAESTPGPQAGVATGAVRPIKAV